jgi:hypothetical protein
MEIKTLLKDVRNVVASKDGWFDEQIAQEYSRELGLSLVGNLTRKDEVPRLRLSQMGECCPRSLWASIHSPSSQEPLPAEARIKFTYGHLIESLAIAMAKAAGHEVTGEQDEVSLLGVKGHRDCIIDGAIVDVKSCNSLSFQKVQAGKLQEDYFLRKYLDQLDGYAVASVNDSLVRIKDKAYIWFIDKVLGKMYLYEHRIRRDSIIERITQYQSIVSLEEAPACTCKTVPHGESGNYKLDTPASYNPYKYFCFPRLRCFLYAKGPDRGPVYLTKVVRIPDVPEVDRQGRVIIN